MGWLFEIILLQSNSCKQDPQKTVWPMKITFCVLYGSQKYIIDNNYTVIIGFYNTHHTVAASTNYLIILVTFLVVWHVNTFPLAWRTGEEAGRRRPGVRPLAQVSVWHSFPTVPCFCDVSQYGPQVEQVSMEMLVLHKREQTVLCCDHQNEATLKRASADKLWSLHHHIILAWWYVVLFFIRGILQKDIFLLPCSGHSKGSCLVWTAYHQGQYQLVATISWIKNMCDPDRLSRYLY